jgi:hypothetical protein
MSCQGLFSTTTVSANMNDATVNIATAYTISIKCTPDQCEQLHEVVKFPLIIKSAIIYSTAWTLSWPLYACSHYSYHISGYQQLALATHVPYNAWLSMIAYWVTNSEPYRTTNGQYCVRSRLLQVSHCLQSSDHKWNSTRRVSICGSKSNESD